MNVPAGHFQINHGNLTVNVPRDIFTGPNADFVEDKAKQFRDIIKGRYPWITDNSADMMMKHARQEMLRIMDEESGGRIASRELASKGKNEAAIKHLQMHLEKNPDDADSWYLLGELLCKSGRMEEGYRALNKGRSLI